MISHYDSSEVCKKLTTARISEYKISALMLKDVLFEERGCLYQVIGIAIKIQYKLAHF